MQMNTSLPIEETSINSFKIVDVEQKKIPNLKITGKSMIGSNTSNFILLQSDHSLDSSVLNEYVPPEEHLLPC